ncbi:outer membrane beta-barrel protein [Prevotella communis]|uniref:outer membrane beta-barrel protein n=1 Tax=Prevotella communis TaxID=2913614 RepID=UPI001EDA44C2|nr:outer membrane beta-barrel protein [Prevotella communis]UKK57117.1 outer membrane beta-barrel protein [Prevotella communis]UKK59820.1 outer membrane beta-barrel protein [Prevotella communis]UKK62564.1 outer membrane beta-barrel protein [Prevotella communis]UKK65389.1 outer membrane beta-barrel protein [Prevotella communis]
MIKRLFQIALPIVMAWLMVMPLSAQGVAFGVKGGLEVVSMEFNDDVFDKSNRAGFFVGPTFVISTALPGLAIDISGLYNERTLKVEGESVQQKSILIPAHVRYGASIMDFGGVFLTSGPQLSFNVGPSKFYWEDVNKNAKQFLLQDTKLAIDFGVGLSIGQHLEAIVYYSIPIGKTGDFTWNKVSKAANEASSALNNTNTTANSWMLSATYIF